MNYEARYFVMGHQEWEIIKFFNCFTRLCLLRLLAGAGYFQNIRVRAIALFS